VGNGEVHRRLGELGREDRPGPDRNTGLVSYPYYAKYAHEGDRTFFRHIDVNIKQLASSGRGANMIQGTVSLDNVSGKAGLYPAVQTLPRR
jgi:hypothetical protein